MEKEVLTKQFRSHYSVFFFKKKKPDVRLIKWVEIPPIYCTNHSIDLILQTAKMPLQEARRNKRLSRGKEQETKRVQGQKSQKKKKHLRSCHEHLIRYMENGSMLSYYRCAQNS